MFAVDVGDDGRFGAMDDLFGVGEYVGSVFSFAVGSGSGDGMYAA